MKLTGIALIVSIATLAGSTAAAARPRTISWAQLRPALAGAFCAERVEIPERVIYAANFGSTGCPDTPSKTPLQRTVLRAFADSRAVLMLSIQSEAARKVEQIVDDEKRSRAYADALLTDAHFLRTLLVALRPDLTCTDCPKIPDPEPIQVGWSQLRDYVAAHAWPDPVVTPPKTEGKPAGKPRYSMHICAGINGISHLTNPDPRLVRAAYVASFDVGLGKLATPLFKKVTTEPPMSSEISDKEKTEYLRRRLGEEIKQSAPIRKAICAALEDRQELLAVRVDPCE
jgi:hypothetical protein